jgi:hypothetical protein
VALVWFAFPRRDREVALLQAYSVEDGAATSGP